MNLLQELLAIISIAAEVAQTYPDPTVDSAAVIAQKLAEIASKAVASHNAIAGQPIDLSKLGQIDPVA